jgi:hypothetical protein
MRKYLAVALVGALGLAFGVANLANAGEDVQTEVGKIKPSKLSKKKYKNVKYINTITTFDDPALNQPPSANRTVLDFPKQMKFNQKKWPKCKTDAAGIEGAATVADAKKACGKKSVVSTDKGSLAKVTVALPGGAQTVIDVDVVAFNEDGNKLLLYSKPTGAYSGIAASILVGKLKKSKSGKKYGKALDVTVPPLAAGAISLFKVTIPKSKYVQARCKPKKMKWQATTYFDNAPTTSDTYVQKCKPKKK